jgi:hypothetical protein
MKFKIERNNDIKFGPNPLIIVEEYYYTIKPLFIIKKYLINIIICLFQFFMNKIIIKKINLFNSINSFI